ncbi:hypothetical protein NDU88_002714 [Pleurodeles waltl]|uniref:Uncharacterized protein n=1 Tax=Pleurodeles waltl TaxID=8319 RepID=A0AAV7UY55_PLEWA|nr:hypothetical protein NDU88_002714 [Pleurodeles waltl]
MAGREPALGPGGLKGRRCPSCKRGSRCPGLRRAPAWRRRLQKLRHPSRFDDLISAGSARAAKEPRWERPLRWGPPGLPSEVSSVRQAARAIVELGPRLRDAPRGRPPGTCLSRDRHNVLVTRPPWPPD